MKDFGWIVPALITEMIALIGIFMATILTMLGRTMDSQKKEIIAEIGKQIAEAKVEIIDRINTTSADTKSEIIKAVKEERLQEWR